MIALIIPYFRFCMNLHVVICFSTIKDLFPHLSFQATFWDNTAHTGLIGLNILGLPSDCTAVGGFTSLFHWNYGVFSSLASSLVLSHVKVAVGKVGINLNIFGPNPVAHHLGRKFISIEGMLNDILLCG